MRFLGIFAVLGVVLVGTVGCSAEEEAPFGAEAEALPPPAAAESGQPHLFTEGDGPVWLSWLEPTDDGRHALRSATLDDTSWTAPQTVATGADWFVNWADLPSVRPLPDGRRAAHYLESSGPSALAYDVRIAQTAGGSWREAVTPHRDGTETEHGFVSVLPWGEHRLLAVWLDGRKMSETDDGHGGGEMTLRSVVLDSTGAVEHRRVIDGRTCECCATLAVRVGDEALVAYRDRSEDEVRDVWLVRFDGETWSEPVRLHRDGWEIEGCPVNGPALAAKGKRVVAAWFTAAGGTPRVKVAFSRDGGHAFTDPVVVAEGRTKGRVDAALLDDGAAVSWLGEEEGDGAVTVRSVHDDSTLSPPTTVATLPSAARRVGFPKMVRSGDRLVFAWVGLDRDADVARVRSSQLPVRQGERKGANGEGRN